MIDDKALDALEACVRALREAMHVVDHASWLSTLPESKLRWQNAVLKAEEVLFDNGRMKAL